MVRLVLVSLELPHIALVRFELRLVLLSLELVHVGLG